MTTENNHQEVEEVNVVEALKGLDPIELAEFISDEHPQIIAFLMSMIEELPKVAATLALLPEFLKADVLYRIANMRHVSKEVIQSTLQTLALELKSAAEKTTS